MPRSHPHRSKKAVEALAKRLKIARRRLAMDDPQRKLPKNETDLRYLWLLWLDANPNLRLQLIEEFARMLGMKEQYRSKSVKWLKEPTRNFQQQRGSWYSPETRNAEQEKRKFGQQWGLHSPEISESEQEQLLEAKQEELLEIQWSIVPGNNNPVCMALTFGFLKQLKSLPENRKEKIRDYFKEAYMYSERSGPEDPFRIDKTGQPTRGRGAPKREERADLIQSAMKAAMIRYAFEPEKSWKRIGVDYFGLKPGTHKRPDDTLQRYVRWLGNMVFEHIVESIWTWSTRSPVEKKEYRQRITREWGDCPFDDTALDEHLGFFAGRTELRNRFFFPQLPVPSKPRRGFAWWEERNARLLIFLAKTLFHIGRTGKLTIPEPFRPKQPF